MTDEIAKEYIALISNLFNHYRELNREPDELTHIQNHVLEYIYHQQRALNLKEISAGLDIAKQQLTKVISELETRGYLIKTPDERDKRAVLISLAPAGRNIEDRKWAKLYHGFQTTLNSLTEDERFDFHFALHKVNALLQKTGGR